jgi:transcriptional regulator with XRE-family HTH domain
MVTGPQIRAARALLGWTADQLAERSGVSPATVWRAENAEGVPSIRAQNLFLLLRTLEQGGVRFIDAEGGEGVGVRLRR